MKVMISGHRTEKLKQYNLNKIVDLISDIITYLSNKDYIIGLSGMANGIDLEFCNICWIKEIPFWACPPFEEQDEYMSYEEKELRNNMMSAAREIHKIRNSQMLEMADVGIIVWDGNKGGTHNVLQQMLEKNKPFFWIEPKSLMIYEIGF